jgi:hypothetical protein
LFLHHWTGETVGTNPKDATAGHKTLIEGKVEHLCPTLLRKLAILRELALQDFAMSHVARKLKNAVDGFFELDFRDCSRILQRS